MSLTSASVPTVRALGVVLSNYSFCCLFVASCPCGCFAQHTFSESHVAVCRRKLSYYKTRSRTCLWRPSAIGWCRAHHLRLVDKRTVYSAAWIVHVTLPIHCNALSMWTCVWFLVRCVQARPCDGCNQCDPMLRPCALVCANVLPAGSRHQARGMLFSPSHAPVDMI